MELINKFSKFLAFVIFFVRYIYKCLEIVLAAVQDQVPEQEEEPQLVVEHVLPVVPHLLPQVVLLLPVALHLLPHPVPHLPPDRHLLLAVPPHPVPHLPLPVALPLPVVPLPLPHPVLPLLPAHKSLVDLLYT
jgi:hypothetical protein